MPPFLIVNADDFNLTEGLTRGTLVAHRDGSVTSATLMVNLPGLERSRDLGGGVMEAGDILVEPITRWAKDYAFEAAFDRTRIVPSILTRESGVTGDATLFLYERSRGRFG